MGIYIGFFERLRDGYSKISLEEGQQLQEMIVTTKRYWFSFTNKNHSQSLIEETQKLWISLRKDHKQFFLEQLT